MYGVGVQLPETFSARWAVILARLYGPVALIRGPRSFGNPLSRLIAPRNLQLNPLLIEDGPHAGEVDIPEHPGVVLAAQEKRRKRKLAADAALYALIHRTAPPIADMRNGRLRRDVLRRMYSARAQQQRSVVAR